MAPELFRSRDNQAYDEKVGGELLPCNTDLCVVSTGVILCACNFLDAFTSAHTHTHTHTHTHAGGHLLLRPGPPLRGDWSQALCWPGQQEGATAQNKQLPHPTAQCLTGRGHGRE